MGASGIRFSDHMKVKIREGSTYLFADTRNMHDRVKLLIHFIRMYRNILDLATEGR
jgi:hypothetical protein